MKITLLLVFLIWTAVISSADDNIQIVVMPSAVEVSKGDEVDLEVFIVNNTSKPITAPPALNNNKDGYSNASVSLYPKAYRFEGTKLMEFGGGILHQAVVDGGSARIDALSSKRYKFKWKCSYENFNVIVIDIEMFAGEESQRTSVAFTPKIQKKANKPEMATPRKPSD